MVSLRKDFDLFCDASSHEPIIACYTTINQARLQRRDNFWVWHIDNICLERANRKPGRIGGGRSQLHPRNMCRIIEGLWSIKAKPTTIDPIQEN